ncbi:Mif2/CENP-C like-domain-containing protein [Gamsiella multidivaricata]|uniref:Mif2/CENP-C like-domain-containing protein n=1 Tax=Gamsiella multidivaricata TaxID=101098 RepID=UPI00221E9C6D|nr:Mif2/CENP-C like-domain-containing protein [Gamsiella multidivaricata]KAI7826179.1 Mif2/CENP-C like-domain-containing protein [Gamsiella multidivaricata]
MSRDYAGGPRVRENLYFDIGVVGRKTGIAMKPNIKKDPNGLDNIDDFWDDGNDDPEPAEDGYDGHLEENYLADPQQISPPPSRSQRYMEQELPAELLSTPTSRRARNISMSKGSGPSTHARGLSLPGTGLIDDEAEEYQSPSFHAVKKRLIFTNDDDSSDQERHQDDGRIRRSLSSTTHQRTPQSSLSSLNKGTTKTPTLDKLLTESRQKKAQLQANTARGPPLAVAQPRQQAASRPANRQNLPKAFDFGVDFGSDDYEDGIYQAGANDGNENINEDDDGDDGHDGYVATTRTKSTPVRSTATKQGPKAVRTPAEFKRKTKAVPAPMSSVPSPKRVRSQHLIQGGEDEDGELDDRMYHEREQREEEDYGRLQFSDEEIPEHDYDQEQDDEDHYRREIQRKKQPQPQPNKKQPINTNTAAAKKLPAKPPTATSTGSRSISERMAGVSLTDTTTPKKTTKASSASSSIVSSRKKASQKALSSTAKGKGHRPSSTAGDSEEGEEEEASSRTVPGSSRGRTGRRAVIGAQTEYGSGTDRGGKKAVQRKPGRPTSSSTGAYTVREKPVELVEVPIVPDVSQDDQGVRRSHRTKIAPLEFWKNERVVLGKSDGPAPMIKAVMRAETKPTPGPARKRKRAPTGSTAQKPQQRRGGKRQVKVDSELEAVETGSSEEDLENVRSTLRRRGKQDTASRTTAEVFDYVSNSIQSKKIAEPHDTVRFRDVEGGEYQYHRGLEDPGALASGTIKLHPSGSKPMTNTSGHSSSNSSTSNSGDGFSMVFFVAKGIVEVTVNKTSFVVSKGGTFLVPRGNAYGVTNMSREREAVLFFVQASAGADAEGTVVLGEQEVDELEEEDGGDEDAQRRPAAAVAAARSDSASTVELQSPASRRRANGGMISSFL